MATKKRTNKKNTTPESTPSLISQNIATDKPVIKKIVDQPIFKPHSTPTVRGAKIWLWVGVGIFSLTIFVLWAWALKIRVDSFSWQKTPENKIVTTAKTDWDKYFAETKAIEENKIKIKNALAQIVNNFNNTTTTIVTTTINTATTTTTTSTP